jgi:hypothetical protein
VLACLVVFHFRAGSLDVLAMLLHQTCFLEKFGDDKSPKVLVMELSSLKMNPKEKVKDFNQISYVKELNSHRFNAR